MNFVQGVFYIAIFSNMAQRQRACYRVARYVILNNVTTATLESKMKNAWKSHWQKRNGNSLNSLYLGVSNSFKDGSSKLNNPAAMVSLFLRFLFSLDFVLFYGCLTLDFVWNDMKLNYKNLQLIFFLSLKYKWKNRCAHFRMAGYPYKNVHTGFFIHT